MPELPEVETIRLKLKSEIIGKTIVSIEVLEKKQFTGNKKEIIGKKIIDIKRSGKMINILLSDGHYINIHLKLSGQLLFTKKVDDAVFNTVIPFTGSNHMPGKTTRIIIRFKDNSGLFFNDLRKFGWFKLSTQRIQPKGVDVLSKDFTLKLFTLLTRKTAKPIKILLMDQEKMTGIGNIYANDGLFLARIHPLRPANSLSEKELNKLYLSIRKVLSDGLKYGGSSGADEAFIQPDGKKGGYQRFFLVYQKEGQPCLVCKGTIKRIKHGGRSSFFCPKCQKFPF